MGILGGYNSIRNASQGRRRTDILARVMVECRGDLALLDSKLGANRLV